MKKIIFLLLILMIAGAPLSEELSFKLGEWNYIELNIPEGRLGGGDYYNVSVKSQSGAYEYKAKGSGIEVRFISAGRYKLTVTVNHITKSSCAGVHIEPHKTAEIIVQVNE